MLQVLVRLRNVNQNLMCFVNLLTGQKLVNNLSSKNFWLFWKELREISWNYMNFAKFPGSERVSLTLYTISWKYAFSEEKDIQSLNKTKKL